MKLNVLSLNVWGVPYAQHRADRMKAIARAVQALSPDIVCFQEVYLADNRQVLQQMLASGGWQHQAYFPSGLVGSGLLTVSRYPITEQSFHRFRLGGKPEDLRRGDYYAGKGIGLTRIQTSAGKVDVYNIHPHAQYDHTPDDPYSLYTDCNLYDAAHFIHTHSSLHPVILAGDYNTQLHQQGYDLITTLAQLVDCYAYLHPDERGITFDPANPYVTSPAQRLDYIMVRPGRGMGFDLMAAEVVLREPLSQQAARAYSDHYGVMVTLEIVDSAAAVRYVPDASDVALVLAALMRRLKQARIQDGILRDNHTEKALMGLVSLLDAGFTLRALLRWIPGWRRLRLLLLIASALYTAYHAFFAAQLLKQRQEILHTLETEIHALLKEKKSFGEGQ